MIRFLFVTNRYYKYFMLIMINKTTLTRLGQVSLNLNARNKNKYAKNHVHFNILKHGTIHPNKKVQQQE